MKDIIVATWGIGEAYRNRIKHNIRKRGSIKSMKNL